MKNRYLISWNDEYLEQRIMAGPFDLMEQAHVLKKEIIRQLTLNSDGQIDEATAELIYTDKLGSDSKYPDIDLSIWADSMGASYRYGSGYESRLQVVVYHTSPE